NVNTASHPALRDYGLFFQLVTDHFFTENKSNSERLWRIPNPTPFVKDSINDRVVDGKIDIVNSAELGTKAAAHYKFNIPANETISMRLRLTRAGDPPSPTGNTARTYGAASRKKSGEPFADFEKIFTKRRVEADEFYG